MIIPFVFLKDRWPVLRISSLCPVCVPISAFVRSSQGMQAPASILFAQMVIVRYPIIIEYPNAVHSPFTGINLLSEKFNLSMDAMTFVQA